MALNWNTFCTRSRPRTPKAMRSRLELAIVIGRLPSSDADRWSRKPSRWHRRPSVRSIAASNSGSILDRGTIFIRIHKTLRLTPAMQSDVTDHLFAFDELIAIVDEWEVSQKDKKRANLHSGSHGRNGVFIQTKPLPIGQTENSNETSHCVHDCSDRVPSPLRFDSIF